MQSNNQLSDPQTIVCKVFGLTSFCTETEFRLAFRRKVKNLLTTSDNWVMDERFRELRAAFKSVLSHAKATPGFFVPEDAETTANGVPLSELGNGLGDEMNGKDCDACEGEGFLTSTQFMVVPKKCTHCNGDGETPRVFTCKICKGEGKVMKGKGKRQHEATCFRCKGTGKFTHPTQRKFCRKCFTSGVVFVEEPEHKIHHVCSRCGGKGEIPIANPVIPKPIGLEIIDRMEAVA